MGAESVCAKGLRGDGEEEWEKARLRRATSPRAVRSRVRKRLFFEEVVGCMMAKARGRGRAIAGVQQPGGSQAVATVELSSDYYFEGPSHREHADSSAPCISGQPMPNANVPKTRCGRIDAVS